MLSSKMSVGTHLLTIFALKPGFALTSDLLAASANTNPVVVRRLLGLLREAGMVDSRPGVSGGWTLRVDPERITLLDVLRAIDPQDAFFALHRAHPSADCPCGLHIQGVLTEVYDQVEAGINRQLAGVTIAALARRIEERVAAASGCAPTPTAPTALW